MKFEVKVNTTVIIYFRTDFMRIIQFQKYNEKKYTCAQKSNGIIRMMIPEINIWWLSQTFMFTL